MFRSLLVAASLTVLVLALGGGSIVLASESQPALNIGFVLYSKGNVPGTLNARWTYQNIYSGKGLATGGPKEGFAGHYHVRYYDEQGKFSDEYDLVLEKAGAFGSDLDFQSPVRLTKSCRCSSRRLDQKSSFLRIPPPPPSDSIRQSAKSTFAV